jgi:signal peptidase
MEPTLRPGDVLVYRRRAGTPRPGDVVVVKRPEWVRPVVHRVVAEGREGGFVTRGDANPIPDREEVRASDVRGRALVTLPVGGVVRGLALLTARARLLLQPNTARR